MQTPVRSGAAASGGPGAELLGAERSRQAGALGHPASLAPGPRAARRGRDAFPAPLRRLHRDKLPSASGLRQRTLRLGSPLPTLVLLAFSGEAARAMGACGRVGGRLHSWYPQPPVTGRRKEHPGSLCAPGPCCCPAPSPCRTASLDLATGLFPGSCGRAPPQAGAKYLPVERKDSFSKEPL